jgi:hypothetical protein
MDRTNATNGFGRGRMIALVGVVAALLLAPGRAGVAGEMKEYQTRYYVIYSDHDIDMVKEAAARITSMAEEYHERTKDFAGQIKKRLPFYLYSTQEDYVAAGGMGAGMFAGNRLMAFLPKGVGAAGWHVVQHEGFHQFVAQVIRGGMPIWANEGLAEYFGEGIWTGDAFVTGVIPEKRLARVKALIADNKLRSFPQMLTMTNFQWTNDLDVRNYDQAWSVVHFLVNADGGKYRKAFGAFLGDVSAGQPASPAFDNRFGTDTKAFEDKYRAWWSSLPEGSTADTYTVAVCQTLMSFLARSQVAGQKFKDVQEFFDLAKADQLQCPKDQWLPPSLLHASLDSSERLKTWSIVGAGPRSKLVLTAPDGTVFTTEYTLNASKDFKVKVDIKHPPK